MPLAFLALTASTEKSDGLSTALRTGETGGGGEVTKSTWKEYADVTMAQYAKDRRDASWSSSSGGKALHPRPQLEELLRKAREEFLRSGDAMLDWNGLEREIVERRGGFREED